YDGDGLSDLDEYEETRTDPTKKDTDEDSSLRYWIFVYFQSSSRTLGKPTEAKLSMPLCLRSCNHSSTGVTVEESPIN
ncbi:MAG: hypothetical protein CMM51_01285, partial [Rhodospirillaceae bacterium]|nr:hypothetical protein [Rhodospirillaceae bacterium]